MNLKNDAGILERPLRRIIEHPNAMTHVKVFANAKTLELFVNGRSLGAKNLFANGVFIRPKVILASGANRVAVKAWRGGKDLHDECE